MTRSISAVAAVLFAALWPAVFSGCRTSPPPNFYHLTPLSSVAADGDAVDLSLGVGPVELPPYLDRSQIVTTDGKNLLDLAEFHQWAEPLQGNIRRVLAENLSLLLGTERVAQFPWKRDFEVDYQLLVDVMRFEGTMVSEATLVGEEMASSECVLVARWTVQDADGQPVIPATKSRIPGTANGPGYTEMVEALNRILEQFSRDVADRIRALPAPGS